MLLLPLLLLLLSPLYLWPRTVSSAPAVSKGLYQASDHVTPLKFDDLQATVYSGGRRRHWLLQLYHSYCGHCINFAPTFKTFADNIKGWSHTVGLAVMDTADVANSNVMSHYGLNGVPSLLFISSNTSWEGKFAAKFDPETDLMDQLLGQLQHYVPQLLPLPPGEAPSSPALLLEEASPGRLSRHLILDSLPGLSLRWRPNANFVRGVRVSRLAIGSSTVLGDAVGLDELRRLLAPLRPPSVSSAYEVAKAAAAGPAASKPPALAPLGELRPPTMQDLRSGIIRALVSDAATVDLSEPGVWPAVRDFVRLLNAHLSPTMKV